MSRVVVAGKDPARTPVSQVMTEDPLTVAPERSPGDLHDPDEAAWFPAPAGLRGT